MATIVGGPSGRPDLVEARHCLFSTWTVTLHHQTLASLAAALRRLGRPNAAMPLDVAAAQVRADFAQRLLADGELAGFAYLHSDGRVDHLLHPRDRDTGIHHRLLPMIHAIIADLLSPEQGPEARNPEKLALPEDQAVRSRGVQDQAYLSLSHPAGSWVWHMHLKRRICFSEVGPVRQR